MKKKSFITNFPVSWLRLLVLCLSLMAFITPGKVEAAEPTYIKIQLEQWNQLKQNTNLLEAKLNPLSEVLARQKSTSTELLTQLAEAKTQLQETQKALTSSKSSLENARASLKRSNELYETLMEAAENDRKAKIKAERQRNIAQLVAGCLALILVTR